MTPREAVTEYWRTAEARDWAAYLSLLSDDVVYEMPQSRERIRGKDRYNEFNTRYPADWHARLSFVIAEGNRAVSWRDFVTDGKPQVAITFFTSGEDELISHITRVLA